MNPALEYIIDQPEPYKSILLQLQIIIEQAIPDIELQYKYKIPFYYYKGKPFCYFNASHKNQYVDVGLCKGNQIEVHQDYQVTENRKKMTSLRYRTIEEIDVLVLEEVLIKAKELYLIN